MKPLLTSLAPGLSMSLLACLLSIQTAGAAEKVSARTKPADAPARATSVVSNDIPVIDIPQSVFIADFADRTSRDPFFPNAAYPGREKATQQVVQPKADKGEELLKQLRVTGAGGVEGQRWVMVNGVTMFVGETATVQIGNVAYKVECLEMTSGAVTVGLKGSNARRELKFN